MPIFLDISQRRKRLFRTAVTILFFVILIGITFFVSSIFFNTPTRAALTYANASESYHYYYSPLNKNKIAITFDDGPRYQTSEKLMYSLEKNDATATFFYIGKSMMMYPNIVADASRRGFTIGNHSFTHSETTQVSESRLSLELHATEYLISRITGHSSFYYRPPYLLGIGVDPTMNPYLPVPNDVLWVMQNGYNPVGSDIDPSDWLATSKENVIERLVTTIQNSPKGHILLLHEDKYTIDAIDDIVKTLRDSGYTIVPLHELLTPPKELALTRTLSRGDTDETTSGEVSQLQWFLYKDGDLDPYLITGVFSPSTESALIRFQFKKHLASGNSLATSVGVTDALTRKAILTSSHSVFTSTRVESTKLPGVLSESGIGNFFKDAYVNAFPRAHSVLAFMVRLTLVLVILRCFLMLAFLVFGKFKKNRTDDRGIQKRMRRQGVSVLIPAYNEQENIRATVESVLRSTHARREIIVIDDGSTDRTGEIVRDVIREHPSEPIRILQVKNGGKALALNHGMRAALYEVCAVLDADAVLDPDALSYFVCHFSNPHIGAVAGKVGTTSSKHTLDIFQTLEYAIGQNIDKRAVSILGAVGVVPGPAGAWKKSFVLDAGGFSTDTLVEDQDMTLTLLRAGRRVAYEERAIAYTETPHTVKNFLKQRFRWVYGTMQCFWKHKRVMISHPLSAMTLIVMPNIFIFNILLPLTYPFADSAVIFGAILSDWNGLIAPFALFTFFDVTYAAIGIWPEKNRLKLLCMVPLQRVVYRQFLYYSVMRGVVRAIEGSGSGWNKFTKIGETQRFYFSAVSESAPITLSERQVRVVAAGTQFVQEVPDTVTMSVQGPRGTDATSMNSHDVIELSANPRQRQSAGDTSSPALSPKVLLGETADPKTYA